jgi:outer membrane immunogenic protein
MKRFLTASGALLALIAAVQPLNAADLPPAIRVIAPVAVPIAVPTLDWTGFYAGVQGGYGWGTTQHVDDGNPLEEFRIQGPAGGATLGFNRQARMPWFGGVEADISASGIKGREQAVYVGGGGSCDCITDVKWFATARLRAGAVSAQSLFYATGGLAYGEIFLKFDGSHAGDTVTRLGWTAGAGWEHAFGPKWSGKLEYLYVAFGKVRYLEVPGEIDTATANFHLVRIGLNYRF